MSEIDPPGADPLARTAPNEAHRDSTEDGRPPLEILDMSPSVRRLVRQYDIDVTRIRGTGPEGRLRPSDILAVVGGAESAAADVDAPPAVPPFASLPENPLPEASAEAHAEAPAPSAPGATIHACDMTRVLAHRRQTRPHSSLASYLAVAAMHAARKTGAFSLDGAGSSIEVLQAGADGVDKRIRVEAAPAMTLDDVAAALDGAASQTSAGGTPLALFVRPDGSGVIELPSPVGDRRIAILGMGGIRRVVGVRTADGQDSPRIFSQCCLSLAYRPDRLGAGEASRFVTECVRALEAWPDSANTRAVTAAGGHRRPHEASIDAPDGSEAPEADEAGEAGAAPAAYETGGPGAAPESNDREG